MRDRKKIFALVLFILMGFFMFTFANPSDDVDSLTTPIDETEDETETKKVQAVENATPIADANAQLAVAVDNAPVITVNPKEVKIIRGIQYNVNTGVTVTDDNDTDLKPIISITGIVDANAGSYTVTYTVTDSANNTATTTRTIIVLEPNDDEDDDGYTNKEEYDNDINYDDTEEYPEYDKNPSITMDETNDFSMEINTDIPKFTASATDVADGDIDVEITHNINLRKLGTYTVVFTVSDVLGNKTEIEKEFTVVDTKAPVIENLVNSSNGDWTNKEVETTWDIVEQGSGIKTVEYCYTVDCTEWKTMGTSEWYGLTRNAERNNTVYVRTIDNANNISNVIAVIFKIDKTAPVFVNENTSHSANNIKIDVSEEASDVKTISVYNQDTDNTFTINNGDELTEEATYHLIATDNAGNTSNVWIAIDKTAPSINVEDGKSYNSDISLEVSDKFLHKGSITINGIDYNSEVVVGPKNENGTYTTTLTKEGTYVIVASDKVGNQTTKTITIDKTSPKITVKTGATETVGSISEKVYSKVSFKLHDAKNIDKVTINGVVKDLTNNTYSDLNNIKLGTFGALEGKNVLVLYDEAGNNTSYEFYLDIETPSISVKTAATETVGSLTEKVYSKVSFKLHDTKKVDKITLNGVVKDLTDSTYSDLNNIKPGAFGAVEGMNTLVLYDIAGNTSTYEFYLDTVNPEITVKTGATETVGSIVENVYNKVSFKLFDAKKIDKITMNGVVKDLTDSTYSDVNFIEPEAIGAVEGMNTLVLYDIAGNTSTYEFYLDTAKPSITVKTAVTETVGSISDNLFSKVSFKLHDAKKVDKITLNGVVKDLTDSTYSDLNNIKPEAFGAVEGMNTLVLYDIAGNTSTYEFYLDTAKPSIKVKTGATETVGTINANVYSKVSFKLSDSKKVDKITMNGVVKDLTNSTYSDLNNIKPGTNGAVEGKNTLLLYDIAGNMETYEFVLDTKIPTITGIENEITYVKTVTFDVSEPIKTYIIDGVEYTETTVDKTMNVIGKHTVKVIDYANNESNTITFQIIPLTYNVIFNDYNGTMLKTQTVIENEAYSAPDMNGKKYTSKNITYSFIGWDKTVEKVTENITLTAVYEITKATVSLYNFTGNTRPLNGGYSGSMDDYQVVTALPQVEIVLTDEVKQVIGNGRSEILTYNLSDVLNYIVNTTVLPIPTNSSETFTKYEWYALKFEQNSGWHLDGQIVVDTAALNSYKNAAINEINNNASSFGLNINSAEITGIVSASGINGLNTKSSIDAAVVSAKSAISSLFAGIKVTAKNEIQLAITNQVFKNNYVSQANVIRDAVLINIDNAQTITAINNLKNTAISDITSLKALSLLTFNATITTVAGDGDYKYLAINDIASDIIVTKVEYIYGIIFESIEEKYTGSTYSTSLLVNKRLQNSYKVRVEYTKNGINYIAKYNVNREWFTIVSVSKYADTYAA